MESAQILVVETERNVAKDLKARLEGMGYGVAAVTSSGKQAIEKAKRTHPDLALLDIALKGEPDAVEAADQLHAHFHVPVVYLTARADARTLKRARIAEPFGYILKPFHDRELQVCVEAALHKHRMEKRLQESERRLSTTLTSIGDAVMATDNQGLVTFMNPVAQSLTGWKQQEALGKNLQDVFRIVNEITRKPVENPTTRVLREGVVVGLANHTLLIAKDGREIPIEDSGAPIRDEEGNTLGVVLVFKDVTERRRAEQLLAQECDMLYALMDNMPDNIYFKDTDSRFTGVNKAKAQKMGLGHPREAMGKTDFDYFTTEFAREAYADEQRILKSGKPLIDKVERTVTPDGQSRWVSATKVPIKDKEGQVTGIVGISRDITERRRAEEAYRALVDHSIQGLLIIQDGGVVFANKAFADISGYTVEEMLAMPPDQVQAFVHPEDRALVWGRHRDRLQGKRLPDRYEFRGIRKDGSLCWLELHASRIEYHGKPAVQAAYVDITERKRAEEERRVLARLATRLAGTGSMEEVTTIVREESERLLGWDAHYLAVQRPEDNAIRVFSFVDTVKEEKKILPGLDWPASELSEPVRQVLNGQSSLINRAQGEITPALDRFGDKDRLSASLMFAPVRSGDAVIGVLSAQSYTQDRYNEADLEILQRIANVVAPALERVHAEEKFRETNELLRAMIQSSPPAIIMLDIEAKVKSWNPAAERIFGWKEQEVLGHPNPLVPEDKQEEFRSFLKSVREGKTLSNVEVRRQKKDGSLISVSMSVAPLRDAKGNIVGVMGILADITEHKRMENALVESERKIRLIAENMKDAVFAYDMDRRLQYVNPAFETLTGYTTKELYEQSFIRYLHPDDEARMMHLWDQLFQGQAFSGAEFRIVRKDGQTRWFSSSWSPLLDENGRQIGVQGRETDVTERNLAEEALRVTNEMLQATIQSSPLAIIMLDHEIRVGLWNPAAERIFGWSEHEVLGRPYHLVPEDKQGEFGSLLDSIENGEAFSGVETRRKKKDGSVIDVSLSAAPLRDTKGSIVGVVGILADITEHKRAEEELKLKAQLLDNAMDSIFLHDLDGNFIYVNESACKSRGYTQEELLRKNLHDLDVPESARQIEPRIKTLMEKGETTFESAHFRKDGTILPVEVHIRLIESGGKRLILSAARDITERKRAAEALRKSHQLLERIFASLRDAVFVIDAGTSEIRDCNPAASEIFGYSRPEMLGRTTTFLHVDETALEEFRKHLHPAVEEKGFLSQFEFRMKRKDGTVFPTEHSVMPLQDEQNKLLGWVSVVRDITERKRAEEALRESEERYRHIFEHSPIGIGVASIEGEVIVANRAMQAITGYSAEELGQISLVDAYTNGEDRKALLEAISRSGSAADFSVRKKRKDGSPYDALLSVSRIHLGGKDCLHTICQDITERKRAEEALRASEEAERRFSAQMTALHEVSNELSKVDSVDELCRRTVELGRGRLGFDRLGVWLMDKDSGFVMGTYGVDENGQLRDERGSRWAIESDTVIADIATHKKRLVVFTDHPLRNDELEIVGRGMNATAALWDGEEIIGLLSTDNLLQGQPITEHQCELLTLYAATLGHLCTRKRAERALRESQAKFQELFDDAPVGYHELDPQGRVVGINRTELAMLGYRADEILGHPVWDFIADADVSRRAFEAKVAGAMPPGLAFERTFRRKDGTTFPVLVSERLFRDEMGRIVGIRVTNQDISERKRAERALREALSRFESVIEKTPLVAIQGIERDGVVRHWNAASERLYGFAAAETVGQRIQDLILPEEDVAGFDKELAEIWETGQASASREWAVRTRTGERRWVYSAMFPIFEGGAVAEVFCMDVDVTDRRRAEEAERHSRMVAEAIAEASLRYLETGDVETMAQIVADQAARITGAQLGIVIDLDSKGQPRIRAASSGTWKALEGGIYEQARRELEEKGFYPLSFGDNLILAPLRDGSSILTNSPAEHPRWAGTMPPWHFAIKSFLDVPIKTGNKVIGLIALANRPGGFTERELHEVEVFANTAALALRMAHSEEERARTEEQLHQAMKMEAVGRLAGGIAHDFNNLLTAIIGYADLGVNALHPAERVRRYFEEIQQASDRAAQLTRQLLAFSRRQTLEPRIINLNDILLDMDRILRRLIGEDVELTTLPAKDLWSVRVDPGQLEQVIINMAVNARDAMPQGGHLTLETTNMRIQEESAEALSGLNAGDYVMLAVTDTGIGMTDQVKEHLFEPFFTTKEVGKGTGLGLATCYGIVKQSGGGIRVESESGNGTSFRIYLPRVGEAPTALPPRDDKGFLPHGTETILLVEDEPLVRTLAVRILEDQGYTVLEAANGEEALRVAKEREGKPIHLLLTDVVMPQMGGKELAVRLRAIQPGLKVLFASGYTDDTIYDLGMSELGTGFLQKPFTPGALARKLREVLDS